jgi:AraC family transcriptional regulator
MRSVEVGTKLVEPGLCDSLVHVDHRLSIHVGRPVPTVCCEGRSPRRYVRAPGGINIVPAGARSRWIIEDPMEQIILRVPYDVFASVARDYGLDDARVQLDVHHQVHDQRIESIAHALQWEMAEANPNGPLFAESLSVAVTAQLVCQFSRRVPIALPRRAALNPRQLARVADYIEERLGSDSLTLKQLSEVAGTSVSYFRLAFKATFGSPVHRYVVERRVEQGARLLAQGGEISDVAAQVGFSHASHMARWMRRLLRTTPSRLQARGVSKPRPSSVNSQR